MLIIPWDHTRSSAVSFMYYRFSGYIVHFLRYLHKSYFIQAACIVFPYPQFLSRTPEENDESRLHCIYIMHVSSGPHTLSSLKPSSSKYNDTYFRSPNL
jgi:hypothetical protein